MLALRDAYRPTIVRPRRPRVVSVGAEPAKVEAGAADSREDDFGGVWKYETKVDPSQVRAVTDRYGGQTSPWFSDRTALDVWIDERVASLALAHLLADDPSTAVVVTPEEPSKVIPASTAAETSSTARSVVLVLIGMIFGGLVVWRFA